MPTVIKGLSAQDYFTRPEINNSGLKLLNRSTLHYVWDRDHPSEASAAMELGTAVHAIALEGQAAFARVCELPPEEKAASPYTNAGKAWRAEVRAAGRIPITDLDLEKIEAMHAALGQHRAAAQIFEAVPDEDREIVIAWETQRGPGGIKCKLRADMIWTTPTRRVVVDLKTTRDASPAGFAKSVANFGYHMQAAHYLDGVRNAFGGEVDFVIIAVENVAPYAVAVYRLTDDAIAQGHIERDRALYKYKAYQDNPDAAPEGYPQHIQELYLPAWAFK